MHEDKEVYFAGGDFATEGSPLKLTLQKKESLYTSQVLVKLFHK